MVSMDQFWLDRQESPSKSDETFEVRMPSFSEFEIIRTGRFAPCTSVATHRSVVATDEAISYSRAALLLLMSTRSYQLISYAVPGSDYYVSRNRECLQQALGGAPFCTLCLLFRRNARSSSHIGCLVSSTSNANLPWYQSKRRK